MPEVPSLEFLEFQDAVAGRYSLECELGRGGMGIVFRAKDVALDRPVAIKLLPPELALQTDLRERFVREARTAARLSHPNIIPVFSVEEVGEFVFFVMAYVEGETVTERINSKGPFTTADAVRVLREVGWALVHAHSQGVVHRDVKPDNILLETGSGRALVTDFGIAQVASVGVDADFGEMFGTPAFMSPEQATGEPVDHRTDLYSVGIVAYLMLAGRLPFAAETPSEFLAHHIRTIPAPLITVTPGVPKSLSAIVERCLAKDPDARIQTAQELTDALGASLESRREVPVPVRLFVQHSKDWRYRGNYLAGPLIGLWIGLPIAVQLPWAGISLMGLLFAYPFLALGHRIRRVVKAGYGQEDVVRAFRRDLESRDEELRFLYGPEYARKAKRLRTMTYWALGLSAASVVGALGAQSASWLVPALTCVLFGAVTGSQAEKRSTRRERRRVKFWRRRFAAWLFRMAGIGTRRSMQIPAITHRPTELAIGMAITSLFHSLPKETQASMQDLPSVVEGLETDAQRMRERIAEFDYLLQHAGRDEDRTGLGEDTLAGQRARAVGRIGSLRDEARRRLSESVAALENLRVDLLRLRAGTVRLDSVTTKLGRARDLAEQVDRLLESQLEVEELLS